MPDTKITVNNDGSIRTVVQTRNGPPPVGLADLPSSNAVRYDATTATVGGGATVEGDASIGGSSIHNLHLPGSLVCWSNVSGGKLGGRATIDLYYAAQGDGKIHLEVNQVDYSFLNILSTGDWSKYTGHSYLTVLLKPGNGNVIKLGGGYHGANLDHITVTPMP